MNIHHRIQKNGSGEGTHKRSESLEGATAISIRIPHSAFRNGFTIIELLVVISIILLLTGILVPSIVRAKLLAYRATTRAYITTLESGALRYKQETQYFPGQDNTGLFNDYTGSQVLVSVLMGIERDGDGGFEDISEDEHKPTSEYVEYKTDHLKTVVDVNGDDREYTPIDSFPGDDAQALLYYPSRLGNDGSITAAYVPSFVYNNEYTGTDDQVVNNFLGLVWDTRFGIGDVNSGDDNQTTWKTDTPRLTGANQAANKAYHADTFLIFGKGISDRDEAYSWFTPQSPKNFISEGYTEPEN